MTTGNVLDYVLQHSGHTHRFVIAPSAASGWELREERDSRIVRQVRYTDWHRVERARIIIDLQMTSLTEHGWHRA